MNSTIFKVLCVATRFVVHGYENVHPGSALNERLLEETVNLMRNGLYITFYASFNICVVFVPL